LSRRTPAERRSCATFFDIANREQGSRQRAAKSLPAAGSLNSAHSAFWNPAQEAESEEAGQKAFVPAPRGPLRGTPACSAAGGLGGQAEVNLSCYGTQVWSELGKADPASAGC